ncbi:hypothetical protein ACLI4Z_14990 [Natrialbaceae archaeon A-arb3/5]
MNRRKVLAVAACISLSGCSNDDYSSGYTIHIRSSHNSVEDDITVCAFEELPSEAQAEVETAIEEGEYTVEGELSLLETDCHGGGTAIKVNGIYYKTRITTFGG